MFLIGVAIALVCRYVRVLLLLNIMLHLFVDVCIGSCDECIFDTSCTSTVC